MKKLHAAALLFFIAAPLAAAEDKVINFQAFWQGKKIVILFEKQLEVAENLKKDLLKRIKEIRLNRRPWVAQAEFEFRAGNTVLLIEPADPKPTADDLYDVAPEVLNEVKKNFRSYEFKLDPKKHFTLGSTGTVELSAAKTPDGKGVLVRFEPWIFSDLSPEVRDAIGQSLAKNISGAQFQDYQEPALLFSEVQTEGTDLAVQIATQLSKYFFRSLRFNVLDDDLPPPETQRR